MIYGCYKLIEKHLNWYFCKNLNVNLFHLQMQQNESQLVRSNNKIDYQMVI